MARLIAAHLGLELELVEAYPPVIAGGQWRGEWDIALASLVPFDAPLPNTVPQIQYSQPYAHMPTGLLLPIESNIQSPAQLSRRRVGALEHSVYQRMLTPAEPLPPVYGQSLDKTLPKDTQLVVLSNIQKSIREIEEGSVTIDAFLGPAPMFEQAIANNKLPLRVIRDSKTLPPHPLVIAAVPQDGLTVDRLITEINTIIAALAAPGDSG